MAKSNDQIRREFDQQGIVSQLGTALTDMAKIAASGATGTLANNMLGGDEAVREARVRAGLPGDVANVGGMALGLKGAGAALTGLRAAARVAPAAAQVAMSGAPVAAARLLTGRAPAALIPAAAPISKAALGKTAALATALGLSIAGRQDPEAPAAAMTPAKAVEKSMEKGRKAERAITPQERAMAAIDTILRQPFTIGELQAATGAIPNVAAGVPKPMSPKDEIYAGASNVAEAQFRAGILSASQLTGEAKDEAVKKITEQYRRSLIETLGADPTKQALLNMQDGN